MVRHTPCYKSTTSFGDVFQPIGNGEVMTLKRILEEGSNCGGALFLLNVLPPWFGYPQYDIMYVVDLVAGTIVIWFGEYDDSTLIWDKEKTIKIPPALQTFYLLKYA